MQENNNVYFLYNNVALIHYNGPRQDQDRKKRIFTTKNQGYQSAQIYGNTKFCHYSNKQVREMFEIYFYIE